MGKGLNILGQGKVGRGMVVAHQSGGRGYRLPVGPVACPWGWWKGSWWDCLPASGGWGAGGGRVARGRTNPTHWSSGGWSVVRRWGGVLIAGWCSGGFGRVDRRRTGCWVRASGVQGAALAGVVL